MWAAGGQRETFTLAPTDSGTLRGVARHLRRRGVSLTVGPSRAELGCDADGGYTALGRILGGLVDRVISATGQTSGVVSARGAS